MKFFKNNGLSIVLLIFFLMSFTGQFIMGYREHNKELQAEHVSSISVREYISSGHFLSSTFENWESEFLQMALFVVLTIFLYQKGSSESKQIGKMEEVDREPSAKRKNAPWPVKKGGWLVQVYKYSLTIALLVLFILSFCLHLYGSWKDENEQLMIKGMPQVTIASHVCNTRFWFESFQNWQSEFLSVFAIIVLSIYLRQKGSSQSKPVDAPHSETGE